MEAHRAMYTPKRNTIETLENPENKVVDLEQDLKVVGILLAKLWIWSDIEAIVLLARRIKEKRWVIIIIIII